MALEAFGGSDGIRDQGGLESATHHPRNVYLYEDGNLFAIAAAYAHHLAESQAFLDGNKRTAIMAALTFLEANGVVTDFDSMALYPAMMDISAGKMDRAGLAEVLKKLVEKRKL